MRWSSPLHQHPLSHESCGSAGLSWPTPTPCTCSSTSVIRRPSASCRQSPPACPSLRTWTVAGSYDEALLDCLGRISESSRGLRGRASDRCSSRVAGPPASEPVAWRRAPIDGRVVEQSRLVKDDARSGALREARATAHPGGGGGLLEWCVPASLSAPSPRRSTPRSATPDSTPAFDTIVASGPHGALPHYRAGDRLLARRPGGAGLWRRLGRILQRLDADGCSGAAVLGSAAACIRGARGATGGDRAR